MESSSSGTIAMQPLTSYNLQNEDFSDVEIPRRHRDQNICDAIYCDDCGAFSDEPCWNHVSHIENTPVVPLALASLPDCLMIDICENSHEKEVFSRNTIYPRTLFGPMVGALCSSTASSPFGCRAEDGSGIKRFHLDSDNCCNWLRYVRFAKNKKEQNLMACQHDGEVYFVVTEEIQADQELKVGYSRSYAEMLKECPEPIQRSPEHVEPVSLSADWEPEIFPVEIVESVEIQPDPVEQQCDEEVNPLVRRNKRKRSQTRFYGAEEDGSDVEVTYETPVHHGPSLPTEEDKDPPPMEYFNVQISSALIPPDKLDANSALSARQKKNLGKKRCRALKKNPALVIKFPCTKCFIHFPSEESLVIHNLWHEGKEMNVDQCPECGLFVNKFEWLAIHVNLHGSRYEPREKCQYCSLYISTRWMDQHIQNSHPLERAVNTILAPGGSDETSTGVTAVNVFKCDECRLFFSSEPLLSLHSPQHSGLLDGAEQECPECNIVIEDGADWIQHINQHGTQMVLTEKCKYCSCATIERGKMDAHVRRAHPNHCGDTRKIFTCDVCGEEMPSLHSLRMHHTSMHKTPQCAICAKIEESWRTLSQHVLIHQEEDGFHCPHCPSIFAKYHRLSAHCGDLHVLKNVRTCELCNKSFRTQIRLNQHLRTHSDDREFSCERCGKGFHTRQRLRCHMKSMHKEAVPAS